MKIMGGGGGMFLFKRRSATEKKHSFRHQKETRSLVLALGAGDYYVAMKFVKDLIILTGEYWH